ncbi:hypothetical protein BDW62DRAFT_217856 [Aspergillus aurantiobrunneus]
MSWSQVSPNRWERPLVGMEQHFILAGRAAAAHADGRENFIMSSKVKVDVDLPDMRYEEPDIAVLYEEDKKVYGTLDEKSLQEWLDATCIVSDAPDAEELCQAHRQYKQSTLYSLPRSSELVLLAHHATLEGIGLMMWWDKYLTALVNPRPDITFGDEHTRLAPPMEEALGYTPLTKQDLRDKAVSLMTQYTSRLPSIGLVSKIGQAAPRRCQNIEYRFSPETTAAFIKGCKAKGVTVTSAVQAAYISMLLKHANPASNTSRYTTSCEFNLRPYLPAPHDKTAVCNYYLAQALNHYYKTTVSQNPEMLELAGYMCRAIADGVQTPEFQSAPVPTDSLVSSLGVVERYLQREYEGKVVVKDYKIAVDIVLGMSMFHLYTFQDELRLVYNFNDAFEEPARIKVYLEDIEKILRKELLGSEN